MIMTNECPYCNTEEIYTHSSATHNDTERKHFICLECRRTSSQELIPDYDPLNKAIRGYIDDLYSR